MRLAITALTAIICVAIAAIGSTYAQLPGTVTVGFKNQSEVNVIVKGYTVVNGQPRAGANLQLPKKAGTAFERNVPAGIRYYTVFDANSFRVLIKDHPVQIQNRDVPLAIVPVPNSPGRLMIVPDLGN
jgi:hypothetical protein